MRSAIDNPARRVAVIYSRVATNDGENSARRLREQESRCRDFANRNGYSVAGVYVDHGVSGAKIERSGINEMLSFLRTKASGSTIVLIDEWSRLARGFDVHLQIQNQLRHAGGQLKIASDFSSRFNMGGDDE